MSAATPAETAQPYWTAESKQHDVDEVYEVYALRYGHREAVRQDHFYERVECGDASMPMDYYTWLAVSPRHLFVIDTGFSEGTARKRGRDFLAPPEQTLAAMGYAAPDVEAIILTHLHWDHTGGLPAFPHARLHVQQAEIDFWNGPLAHRGQFEILHEDEDLAHLAERVDAGTVERHQEARSLTPGLSIHAVGGHTPGMQVVRVDTARGPVVLASDASHFWRNIEEDKPYAVMHSLPMVYTAFDTIRRLAGPAGLVVPGHDPEVLTRFPPASPDLHGLAVRIA